MKQHFDCTFIPSDLPELWTRSELDPALATLFMTLIRLDLVVKMFLFWRETYFLPLLPLQLSSCLPILKCLFQHSRLNCFSLRVGHRTQGILSFHTSKWRHCSPTVYFFPTATIKSSMMTELLLIISKFKQRGFISTIIHAHTYTAEDVWTLIMRGVVTSQTQLPSLLPTPPQPSV